jgi:hypothetical protein
MAYLVSLSLLDIAPIPRLSLEDSMPKDFLCWLIFGQYQQPRPILYQLKPSRGTERLEYLLATQIA